MLVFFSTCLWVMLTTSPPGRFFIFFSHKRFLLRAIWAFFLAWMTNNILLLYRQTSLEINYPECPGQRMCLSVSGSSVLLSVSPMFICQYSFVWLPVCLSVHLPKHPSFPVMSVFLTVCLIVCMSVCRSLCLTICLSICLSIFCLYVRLCVYLPTCISYNVSVCMSVRQSASLCICQSVVLSSVCWIGELNATGVTLGNLSTALQWAADSYFNGGNVISLSS